jgi:hypothetical protein
MKKIISAVTAVILAAVCLAVCPAAYDDYEDPFTSYYTHYYPYDSEAQWLIFDRLDTIFMVAEDGAKFTKTLYDEPVFYGDWGDSPEEVVKKSGGKVEMFPDNTIDITIEGQDILTYSGTDMTYSDFYLPGYGDIETIYEYTFDAKEGLTGIQIAFSYSYGIDSRYKNGRKITEQLPDALEPITHRGNMKTYEPNFINEHHYQQIYDIWYGKLLALYGEPVLDKQDLEYDFDDRYVFTDGKNDYALDWWGVVQPYVYITPAD